MSIEGKALADQAVTEEILGPRTACSYIHEGAGSNREKPGLVGIFTHTPVFNDKCDRDNSVSQVKDWQEDNGFRVDLFSVVGPALDNLAPPYFNYFVSSEKQLDRKRYGEYMNELFKMARSAFFDESKAIEFVLPESWFGSFLSALDPSKQSAAVEVYYSSLEAVL